MKQVIEQSFQQYAGAVLQSRALVDVRDCLKPSARQIFYSMHKNGLVHNKPFKKTMNAVGLALVDFYIHGDSSCEGVIMRAAQPFALRYPLVEVYGNGGTASCSGNWAAPRYTSARLSKVSEYLFEDIKKDTVAEWRDNYEDTQQYPAVLPSKGFYNVVNGTFGVGIGASSSIPQFNIKDVNRALINLLKNPDCSFEEIYCRPDFATGAYLINETEVKESLKNGNGSACKLRSVIEFEDKTNCFVVKEIPFGVYTNTICEELNAIIDDEENNPGIEKFNDLTGQTPLIKIYIAKTANPQKVLKYLYKNTSLQYYYGVNMTMLDNGRYPRTFTWKEMLQAHIGHEKEVYRRGYEYDLNELRKKLHIIDGLLIALASIDEVIKVIKTSESAAAAEVALTQHFELSSTQAKAILAMKLSRLAKLEVNKLEQEKKTIEGKVADIEAILNDKVRFETEMINGWEAVAVALGDNYRTKIITVEEEVEDPIEEIPPQDCAVIITKSGYVKRIPAENIKTANRNTKGVKTNEDIVVFSCKTNTRDSLMVYTSLGKVYKLLVDNIPEGTNTSKGTNLKALIAFDSNEVPMAFNCLNYKTKAKYVFFATKNGIIKRVPLSEYSNMKKTTGIKTITFKDNDKLVGVTFIEEEEMLLVTKNGMVLRFNSAEMPVSSRIAQGVKGIKLADGDELAFCLPISLKDEYLVVTYKDNCGKKIELGEFALHGRATKGISCGNGEIAGAVVVGASDRLLISGNRNSICISTDTLPVVGRKSSGVKIFKDNSTIQSVSKI